jgi:hypothetical protein
MKRILTVALIVAAMTGLGSTTAFADPPPAPGLPGDTAGPNSGRANGEPLSNESRPGENFGNCQSQFAQMAAPGEKNANQVNPAIATAGQEPHGWSHDLVCP